MFLGSTTPHIPRGGVPASPNFFGPVTYPILFELEEPKLRSSMFIGVRHVPYFKGWGAPASPIFGTPYLHGLI